MMLDEINKTIDELENKTLTYDICNKLASLYIIRETHKNDDEVVEELNDILPSYQKYKEIKRDYQLGRTNRESVLSSTDYLCKEIQEFIQTLFSTTDSADERLLLINMIKQLEALL